jgi:hypothetical protein
VLVALAAYVWHEAHASSLHNGKIETSGNRAFFAAASFRYLSDVMHYDQPANATK